MRSNPQRIFDLTDDDDDSESTRPRRDPPPPSILRIDPSWDHAELETARDNIIAAMFMLDTELTNIKGQLERALDHRRSTGCFVNPDWYRRASAAQRHKGRQRQAHQLALGEVNRRLKAVEARARDASDERQFIRIAKELLPAVTYERIWEAVRQRQLALQGADDE
jgi:hypothetical protein